MALETYEIEVLECEELPETGDPDILYRVQAPEINVITWHYWGNSQFNQIAVGPHPHPKPH